MENKLHQEQEKVHLAEEKDSKAKRERDALEKSRAKVQGRQVRERARRVGSWYLLFPRHGLAIELCHGCWISWDGRVQPHCTAVPDVAEGDRPHVPVLLLACEREERARARELVVCAHARTKGTDGPHMC